MTFLFRPKPTVWQNHSGVVKRAGQIAIAALVLCVAIGMRLDSDALENTPLANAVERNDLKAAAELLQSGADPNKRFVFINRPVRSAFWDNAASQWHGLKSIAAAFDQPQQESLLWMTVWQNKIDMARLLARHGANTDLAGNDKDFALLRAAGDGNAAFVRLLVAAGADVNQSGADGQTALTHAIGSASVYNLEIERRYQNYHNGASDSNGYDYSETTRLLLAAGANPNTPMAGGETPLGYARREGLFDFVTPLTEAGAK